MPEESALAWYYDQTGRVQAAVRAAVPARSTVLVVSRGDEELVRLGPRRAWHFPREPDGRYAGYHPADSEAAIAHLEQLRAQGADYIVFPASDRWWLEFYAGFADHLNTRYSVVADDEATCTIYGLRPEARVQVSADEVRLSPHLGEYLDTLLPDRTLAVLRLPDADVPLHGRQAVPFPSLGFDGDAATALSELDEIAARGVRFLVVPHAIPSWLDEQPGFMAELEQRYRRIARQRHVCTVFALSPQSEPRDHQPDPAESHDASLTGRLLALWRGMRP